MTEPTYRIVSTFEPSNEADSLPWIARAYQGESHLQTEFGWGATRDLAIAALQSKLRARLSDKQAESFLADEFGEPHGPVAA